MICTTNPERGAIRPYEGCSGAELKPTSDLFSNGSPEGAWSASGRLAGYGISLSMRKWQAASCLAVYASLQSSPLS